MIVQTFEAFATSRGAGRHLFGEPGLHARGHMSDAAHRRAVKRMVAADAELEARRAALRVEWAALIARGEVREPTSSEALARTASGEGQAAEAARRVLARREARANGKIG